MLNACVDADDVPRDGDAVHAADVQDATDALDDGEAVDSNGADVGGESAVDEVEERGGAVLAVVAVDEVAVGNTVEYPDATGAEGEGHAVPDCSTLFS